MDSKKIIMLLVILGMFGLVAWQGMEMFGGGGEAPEQAKAKVIPNPDIPKPATMSQAKAEKAKAAPMTEREIQLMQEQQRMQEKYMATLSNLQQLTADLAIAEANKLIMKARQETIESQKKIVTILTPPEPTKNYSESLSSPGGTATASSTTGAATTGTQAAQSSPGFGNVTVVSVTNIRGKWNAVVGANGKLYNLSIGDTLPTDGSVVTSISKSGITLTKDDKEVKVAMNTVV